jgi:hypothetical protein
VTPPGDPGKVGRARRPSLILLAVPIALMAVTAAITPPLEFFTNQGDVGLYLQKATAVTSGQVPYRDVPLEYPPLALVPMLAPYLVLAPFGEVTLDAYKWAFVAWEAALLVALGLVVARIVALGGHGDAAPVGSPDPGVARRVRNTTIRLWILCAATALSIAWRFDIFPALLATVAVWTSMAGRAASTGLAVGLGILAKLYPVVLAPALAAPWLARLGESRLTRFGAAAGLAVLLGVLPFVAAAGPSALGFVSYQAQRGLQVEALASGFILLDGLVRGRPAPIVHDFGSVQVAGPAAEAWLASLPYLAVVGFALLAWLGWRRVRAEVEVEGTVAPRSVVMLATASVLVLLLTSKVFSIQYVVWLVPFAALLRRPQFWIAAIALGLTMPIHPLMYGWLVEQQALPVLVLNLRNALLLLLTGLVIWDLRPAVVRRGGSVASRGVAA